MSSTLQTLHRALASPRVLWVVLITAFVLGLPTLDIGLVGDDVAQFEFLQAHARGQAEGAWWNMFALVEGGPTKTIGMRTSGRYPWWVDPELQIVFFRPLAVATHHLDHRLWPERLGLMHLHSVLWHVVLCGLGWLAARRSCSSPTSAGLAALVFTLAFSHTTPVAWLAHRNGLISASFGLAALIAHDYWRRDQRALAGVGAVVSLIAALLSAEAGLVTLALIVAHALVLDEGTWRARCLAVLPSLVTVLVWRLSYSAADFGAHGSGAYIDPVGDLAGFVAHFPMRYLWLAASSVSLPLVVGVPPWLWIGSSVLVGLSVIAFVVQTRSKPALFGLVAAALGWLPLTVSHPGDRLLVLTSFAMAMVFAEALESWTAVDKRPLERVAALLIVVIHVVAAPVLSVWRSTSLDTHQVDGAAVAFGAQLPADLDHRGLVVVHAPSFVAVEVLPLARRVRGLAAPNFLWLLHDGVEQPVVTRVDGRTIELETTQGWPADELSAYWRSTSAAPFAVGERVKTLDYTATVLEVDDGKPVRVRFEFRTELEHGSFAWATWDGGDFVPIDLASFSESIPQ